MNNLDAIYVDVDDFCLLFEPAWQNIYSTLEKNNGLNPLDFPPMK